MVEAPLPPRRQGARCGASLPTHNMAAAASPLPGLPPPPPSFPPGRGRTGRAAILAVVLAAAGGGPRSP